MAVYSKLLLSTGGGIISTRQQAEQAQNTASVLIGLGGTGIDCLRTIKTQVYSRLKADDPEAVAASYSHIRFLGIDTAEKSRGSNDPADGDVKADSLMALDDTEFFSIGNPNVKKAFTNMIALERRPELSWLRWEEIEEPDLGKAGAGGIRQVGRYMMMDRSNQFLGRIEQEINAAKSGLAEPTVNIHIFSGLSGGTGAGCFLDVCYMVRSIADKVGGVTMFGYFFLPDVNLDRVPFADTKTRAYIPKNGYASMQELDYCMQLQYNGGSFVQEYQGHKKIEWKTGPVDMCHLICATNSSGDVIPNAYDYAMNVTAEYVMDFLTFSDKAFDLTEQLSNFRQKVRTADGEKVIGSNLAYCVIGASCASIPLREINTYLASGLFEAFSQIEEHMPARADVETLAVSSLAKKAQNVGDIYGALWQEICDGADNDYAPYTDDWKFVRDYGNAELITHYTNQTAEKRNRAEANARSMVTASNTHSLLGRLRTELADILRDINRGPIYAYRLISAAESHNFLNIIDGLLEENTSKWNQEAAQNSLREKDYKSAKSDFEKRRRRRLFDSDEARFHDYEYYLMLMEQHKLSMGLYEKLDGVLKDFRKQVVDVAANYYIRLNRVMETLMNTFRENHNALSSEKIMKAKGSFAIPMMTIAELKKTLDEAIERINVPGMLDTFMQLLIDREEEWILEDENKISRLVTGFFVDTAFEGFANRTITSFLKAKYGIENDERLVNKIYEDWMKLLTAKASPLFYFNGSIWREDQTSKLAFLSVPMSSAPIKAAAYKMRETNSLWDIKESALTDRIYVMCSACALPLSAYNNCEEYERVCFSTRDNGRYCYEGKPVPGMKFDDWRKLPSLQPQSMLKLDDAPHAMKELIQTGRRLYEEADGYGIFDEHNCICRPEEEAVEKIRELLSECRDSICGITKPEDIAKAAPLFEQLSGMTEIPMCRTPYAMQNDGFAEKPETRKEVCRDHFVAAPVYQMIVQEIMEQMRAITDAIAAVRAEYENMVYKIREVGQDMADYCDAVFTGVIALEGRMVIYHQNRFDREDITLSKRGEGFEFGSVPVYQGFVSYQKLPGETREEIRKKADERYNADDPEVQNTGTRLLEEFTDDRIRAWVQAAGSFEQRKDIVEFLGNMKKRFDTFCLENGLSAQG